MVEIYHCEVARTQAAYEALKESHKNLKAAFENQYSDFSTLPERVYDADSAFREVQRKLKKNAWRAFINMLEIRKVLSTGGVSRKGVTLLGEIAARQWN